MSESEEFQSHVEPPTNWAENCPDPVDLDPEGGVEMEEGVPPVEGDYLELDEEQAFEEATMDQADATQTEITERRNQTEV